MSRLQKSIVNIALPLILGGGILYWMYRDFDFGSISHVLWHEMDWTWMIFSMPFGILAQMCRGWRWRQLLNPLGEFPRKSTALLSIFLSYAASLVVPRSGEFARCGVLTRYDGISFSKSLGTVVTERVIDMLLMLIVTGLTLLFAMRQFGIFFDKTGTSLTAFLGQFSTTGYIVSALCAAAALVSLHLLLRRLTFYEKIKMALTDMWHGILSIKNVANFPLFIFYTLAIWVCYFLHYYLTFFCFDSTASLGPDIALVTFVVGTIAVVVPTPNGAGPWHFAVKTMLILYGVPDNDALYFVLIVHTLQTFLVILLGVFAYIALSFIPKRIDN